MTTYGDLLYIGTGGGVLLALRCSTMELHFAYHAYSDAIRSLLVILPKQQTIAFTRLMSFEKSQIQVDDHYDATTQQMDQKEASQSPLRNTTKRLHLNLKPVEPLPAERSVLISFGHGYRGVVGDYANYPQEFILPSQGKKAASKPAKPCTDDGHLLIWSTEHDTRDLKRVPRLMSSPSKLHTLDQSRWAVIVIAIYEIHAHTSDVDVNGFGIEVNYRIFLCDVYCGDVLQLLCLLCS